VNIAEKVKALELPDGQYVVIDSGSMEALGLIHAGSDVDLAVSEAVFQDLRAQGWELHEGHGGKEVLRQGDYDVGIGYGQWSLEELLADAFVIDGVPFMNLEKVLEWKKAARRQKDMNHIALIEAYVQSIK
jgi:hypothetical protein